MFGSFKTFRDMCFFTFVLAIGKVHKISMQ